MLNLNLNSEDVQAHHLSITASPASRLRDIWLKFVAAAESLDKQLVHSWFMHDTCTLNGVEDWLQQVALIHSDEDISLEQRASNSKELSGLPCMMVPQLILGSEVNAAVWEAVNNSLDSYHLTEFAREVVLPFCQRLGVLTRRADGAWSFASTDSNALWRRAVQWTYNRTTLECTDEAMGTSFLLANWSELETMESSGFETADYVPRAAGQLAKTTLRTVQYRKTAGPCDHHRCVALITLCKILTGTQVGSHG